jgi:ribonuclease HI
MDSLFAAPQVQATLFADGGSRGNPGHAASGAVIVAPDGTVLAEAGSYLGIATNNVAEWNGLVEGLAEARRLNIDRLAVRLDSELVIKQLTGEYRVKHPGLQPFHQQAKRLMREFTYLDLKHVPRKENKLADALVNHVLDEHAAGGTLA